MSYDRRCDGCKRRQARIEKLVNKLEDSEAESRERGKALESLNQIITAWDIHMSPDLYSRLRTILDIYIERCTCKGSTGKKKYERGRSRWKQPTTKKRKKSFTNKS